MSYKIEESTRSVIETVGKNNTRRRVYFFVCDECKGEVKGTKSEIVKRKSRLCRYCSNQIKLNKARIVGNCNRSRPYESLYKNVKSLSIRKEIVFLLSYEEFLEFVEIKNCFYCGEDIKWSKFNTKKNGYKYNLDRKKSDLGYVKENLVVCCWRCNNSKSNRYTYEEWYGMTEYFRHQASELDKQNDLT